MTFINYQSKEINCKIIYFGPARSGKTRSLKYIYEQTKPENRGEMITLQAQDESTLYFDFIPLFLG